jgi:hypothetical protein
MKLLEFPAESLSPGFSYPPEFTALSGTVALDVYYPWLFLDTESDRAKDLLDVARAHNGFWVPFATLELGDGDVACFDGSPGKVVSVRMLVFDRSGRDYRFATFREWMHAAGTDAAKYGFR